MLGLMLFYLIYLPVTSILSDGLANFKIAGDRSDLIATERLDLVVQSSALENYVG